MPAYGALPNVPTATGQPPVALAPGDSMALFNAEASATVAAYFGGSGASIAVAISPHPGGYKPIAFDVEFATAPTGNVLIQGAMQDTDSSYQTLYTSTTKQRDNYADYGGFVFYRAKPTTSSGGGNPTVTVRRELAM